MTKRRPPRLEQDPPWLRLGPAADDPHEGGNGERLWQKITEGVKPLGETKHKKHARAAAAAPSPLEGGAGDGRPLRPALRAGHLSLKGGGKSAPASTAPPPLVPGELGGLDRRSGERLRKGQMPIEAKLDLHGMTQTGAHAAVSRFIAAQQAAARRCVLIVTGKGGKSGDLFAPKSGPKKFTFSTERGVLRAALPRWLNEPALRAHIVAVSPARPEHGGAGAVYVLLKRKRS
jgi:DNA-nicking Smr family endonuclease